MGIEKEIEEVQVTEQRETTKYVCDVEECDEHVENWDPKGDADVALDNVSIGHNIRYVSLDPYVGMDMGYQGKPEIQDRVGVYVCWDHVDRAMDLILEKLSEDE